MGGAGGLLYCGVVGGAGRGQPGLVRQAAQHGHVVHGEVVAAASFCPSHASARALSRRGDQSASSRPSRCTVPVWHQPRQCAQQGGFAAVGADDASSSTRQHGQMNVPAVQGTTDASAHLVSVDSYQLRSMSRGHSTPLGGAPVHQPQQVAAAQHGGEHAHRQLLRAR